LENKVLSVFGTPSKIITDQAKSFSSGTFQEFLAKNSIKWTPTSGYHPETNGQCERMNSSLIESISALLDDQRLYGNDWSKFLPYTCYAYNNSPHSVTGFSPFFLTFMRHPSIPVDREMLNDGKADEEGEDSSIEIRESVDENFRRAWEKAGDRIVHRQLLAANRFNQRHRYVLYLVGDLVMIRVSKVHKFGTRYVGPFVVLRRLENRPLVYKVQDINYPYKRFIINARRLKLYYHPELRFYENLEGDNGIINPTRRCTETDQEKLLGYKFRIPKARSQSCRGRTGHSHLDKSQVSSPRMTSDFNEHKSLKGHQSGTIIEKVLSDGENANPPEDWSPFATSKGLYESGKKYEKSASFLKSQSLPILSFPDDLELGAVEVIEDGKEEDDLEIGSMVAIRDEGFSSNISTYSHSNLSIPQSDSNNSLEVGRGNDFNHHIHFSEKLSQLDKSRWKSIPRRSLRIRERSKMKRK